MRYKSLLYLRAGAIFTRSFARGSGLQRGEREQEARLSRAEGEKGGSFGWLRGVNANLKIPLSLPLLPSWFPGANDTSSFINGVRVAALDLIYACI